MGNARGLFFFILVFYFKTVDIIQIFDTKVLLMTGFEARTSGVGCDHSTN